MMMTGFLDSRRVGLVAAAFAAVVMVAGGASVASAAGKGNPFPKLKGTWKCVRGGCWIRPVGGAKERVGCRVRYKVGSGSKSIAQSINCRGSIKMTASAKVRLKKNNRVSGSWSSYNNHTGRTSGGASGNTTSSKLYVGISAANGFRGAMRAVISGKRHTVTLYQRKNGKRHIVGRLSLRR
jgi:hypothetical protein